MHGSAAVRWLVKHILQPATVTSRRDTLSQMPQPLTSKALCRAVVPQVGLRWRVVRQGACRQALPVEQMRQEGGE